MNKAGSCNCVYFFNESYTEVGYLMLIFKSKIIIFGLLSFTTPIRFVLYPSYTNNKETFMKSKYFQKMPKIGKTLQDSFIVHINRVTLIVKIAKITLFLN